MVNNTYGKIPIKLSSFYDEAYSVLAKQHDANKEYGGLDRTYKTGLDVDRLKDYFTEFCYMTYRDCKYDFTDLEFADYFRRMRERKRDGMNISADSFREDITINICLLYYEATNLYFIHRSFQEYFCARHFVNGSDRNLPNLVKIMLRTRRTSDKTLFLLYEMAQDRVEEFIIIPFLEKLLKICYEEIIEKNKNNVRLKYIEKESKEDRAYWNYINLLYVDIERSYKDGPDSSNDPGDFLYRFILECLNIDTDMYEFELPIDDRFKNSDYAYIDVSDTSKRFSIVPVDVSDIPESYYETHDEPEIIGSLYIYNIKTIHDNPEMFPDLYEAINSDSFCLKQEYNRVKYYYGRLKQEIEQYRDEEDDDEYY